MNKPTVIDSYADLYDATVKMEYELERFLNEGYEDGLEGRVKMINGKWRVSVIVGSSQLELFSSAGLSEFDV